MAPPISDEDCLRFGGCYRQASVGDNGLFRVANIPVPPGESRRWAFHLLERRDASHLQALGVAAIDSLDATVIDGTRCALGPPDERTPDVRTVTVFAESGDGLPLISMRRGKDFGDGDLDGARSLVGEALEEFQGLVGKRRGDQGAVPLICLEPELGTSKERRRLLTEGVPYAIKVEPESCFSYPTWHPGDPFDAFDNTTAESIVAAYRADADPAKATFVPIRDLQGRGRTSGMFEEYLFRFPSAGRGEYFVARPALPPSTPPAELLRGAGELAEKARSYARSSPAKSLRLHEFHSAREERFHQVVNIVARAHHLNPVLGKDPGIASPGA